MVIGGQLLISDRVLTKVSENSSADYRVAGLPGYRMVLVFFFDAGGRWGGFGYRCS